MRTSDADSEVVCPTCERDDFTSAAGMKRHHSMMHGESIAKNEYECDNCGEGFTRYDSNDPDTTEHDFCSQECYGAWKSGESFAGKVELTCEWCGETYEKYPSQRSQFCSVTCKGRWMSDELVGERSPSWEGGNVKLTCEWCDDTYEAQPSRADESRFCSRECTGAWMSDELVGERSPSWNGGPVDITCDSCGEMFKVGRRREDTAKYCSYECLHGKGSEFDYGPGWNEEKKQIVRERDNYECQGADCDMTQAEHLETYGCSLNVHHIIPAREFDDPQARNHPDNLISLCFSHHNEWEASDEPLPN